MDQLVYGPFISRKQAKEQGLKQFFTGKPCKHEHVSTRFVNGWLCCDCNRLQVQKQRDTRGEILNAQRRKDHAMPEVKARRNAQNNKTYKKRMQTKEGRLSIRASGRKNNAKYQKSSKGIAYRRQYRSTTPLWKVKHNLRTRLRELIQNRSLHFSELTGCDGGILIAYLEAQFSVGMTWDNYGLYGWHIDHIRPCASFDLTDPEQHTRNLQQLPDAPNHDPARPARLKKRVRS